MKRPMTKREVAELLAEAAEAIAAGDLSRTQVNVDRAKGKRDRINPTFRQAMLLQWIRKNPGIGFAASLGMDWRALGGLFSRGLLTWDSGKIRVRR